MALVRQLTTVGFRPKSKYEYIVPRLSKCSEPWFKGCWFLKSASTAIYLCGLFYTTNFILNWHNCFSWHKMENY